MIIRDGKLTFTVDINDRLGPIETVFHDVLENISNIKIAQEHASKKFTDAQITTTLYKGTSSFEYFEEMEKAIKIQELLVKEWRQQYKFQQASVTSRMCLKPIKQKHLLRKSTYKCPICGEDLNKIFIEETLNLFNAQNYLLECKKIKCLYKHALGQDLMRAGGP